MLINNENARLINDLLKQILKDEHIKNNPEMLGALVGLLNAIKGY